MKFVKAIHFQRAVLTVENNTSIGRVISIFVFGMCLALSSLDTFAQHWDGYEGDRARIHVPSMQNKPMAGVLGEVDNHGMILQGADSSYFIQHSSIRNLYVNTGEQSRVLKGATLGLIGGVILGGTIGLISYKECTEEGLLGCFLKPETRGEAFGQGAVIGAIPGALIGAAIVSAKNDAWKKMPDQVLLGVKPTGNLKPDSKPQLTFRWSIGSKN